MGLHGPLPKPGSTESQRGRNTLRRKGPPRADVAVPPPAGVARDPAALAFWEAHVPALVAAKRLRPEHAATFAVVCHVASECESLAARVAAEGPVVSTGRSVKANPACRLLRDARRDLFQFAAQFGLTTMADARLPAEPEKANDDDALLAAFMATTRTA